METATFTYKNIPVAFKKTGQGKPVIILHGWGSSSKVMMPLAAKIGEFRTCYIPDFPGFGDSPPPGEPWAIDDYASMLEQFIKSRKLEGCDIIAHSFGARVILKLAARQPKLLDKILITGGAGMKPRRSFKYYMRTWTAKVLKSPFLILPGPLREKGLTALRKTTLWKSLGSSEYRTLDGVMRRIFVKTVTEYLEPCLPGVENEVLLLWGKNDPVTPLYQAIRMEKGLKNAALVTIDNAGHYAFLDQPSRFYLIAEAFFKN